MYMYTPIDQNRQADLSGASHGKQRVDGGAGGAPGVKHVIHQPLLTSPPTLPILSKPNESSKFSSESLLPEASSGCTSGLGAPPELWIPFCSLSIEQLEGKDSFLFLLLFFLRPQHKASCSSHSRIFGWVN